MTWWALCRGEDLECCRSCSRNVENTEPAALGQVWLTPHTQDGKCIDHRGIPDKEPRGRNG